MSTTDRSTGSSQRRSTLEPRIAILVLGCLLPVYDRCVRTIRRTWAAQATDGVDVFYVYGGQTKAPAPKLVRIEDLIGQARPHLRDHDVRVFGDIILCGAEDLTRNQADCILRKRLIAFGYLADAGYDFVYTVCASSHVDVAALKRYAGTLPPQGIYHGPVAICGKSGYPFVSGASMLLSRDMAARLAHDAEALIVDNKGALVDDVAFGRWIAEHYCDEPLAEICSRIAAGEKATGNQAFVKPDGHSMMNFVEKPVNGQVPHERAYHYHFHSRRMWQMEDFHRRYFTPTVRYAPAPGVKFRQSGSGTDSLLVDDASGGTHAINASAAAVLELFASGKSLDETTDALLARHNVDRATLERDVRTLVDELLASGLIAGVDDE